MTDAPAPEAPAPDAPKAEETPQVTLAALEVADRCDYCSAQAFVSAQFLNGVLMFCGHDFVKHEAKIREGALQIRDDRDRINQKPSASANAL